ncbi:MAG: flavodoxin-dependent (E)-4-hydroxy-3-methylbut-2-enyl-diphosphate synthase [Candidatus Omnitrophica bacterium]|nr:flavodoxin-dependent (E)-4-hydroxy-3-methylbut-2-enyl-diphosphate synthase [Candidatus Omnitrophota bacterium]
MPKIIRRKTATVAVGKVLLGSEHPVVVQAMTDTPTADVDATLAQTLQLIESGAEMVRWTINDEAAAVGAIRIIDILRANSVQVPIIGDFHFNGHTLLEQNPRLAELLDKYRINPGNVGGLSGHDENFARIIRLAVRNNKAVRIGVNWGSLDRSILAVLMDANQKTADPKSLKQIMYDAVIQSALDSAAYALELGLPEDKLVLSAKLSVVVDTIEVYRRLSRLCGHVLHLGLTEAGGGTKGIVSSAAALGILLEAGIGDTIRVSLTPEPGAPRSREVEVCQELLQSLGLRYFIPSVTSCPGCGRTKSAYFQSLAQDIQKHVTARMIEWRKLYPGVEQLRIAVMGCVVNGPGESRHADIGISLPGAFEEPVAPVYIEGEKRQVLRGDQIKEEFIAILEGYVAARYKKPAA